MPEFERDGISIHYEEHGAGYPVLLLAPGGMRSSIDAWDRAPWNPIEQLTPHHRVIAMDQRNAGRSVAPVRASDGWAVYVQDQLALLDHLGVQRAHVLGMCIGGAFIVRLLRDAPDRIGAAVLLQPIGLDGNRSAFVEMFDTWAAEQSPQHPEAGRHDWDGFREGMYGGDDLLFSVPSATLDAVTSPVLVLRGDDLYHPPSASKEVAERVPGARLIERWKEPEHRGEAQQAVQDFLAEHTPHEVASSLQPAADARPVRPPAARRRWTSFVADESTDGGTVRGLHEQTNPRHRMRVEHDAHTLLIHLSDEDGGGWTTIAIDRSTRQWAVVQDIRQADTARDAYDTLYGP